MRGIDIEKEKNMSKTYRPQNSPTKVQIKVGGSGGKQFRHAVPLPDGSGMKRTIYDYRPPPPAAPRPATTPTKR